MPRTVVLDELLLTIRVPENLPAARLRAVRRALAAAGFQLRLRGAVRAVVAANRVLAAAGVTARFHR